MKRTAQRKKRPAAKNRAPKRRPSQQSQNAKPPKDDHHWTDPLVDGAVEFAVRAAAKAIED